MYYLRSIYTTRPVARHIFNLYLLDCVNLPLSSEVHSGEIALGEISQYPS
jgi:hypothetical protein